MQVVERVLVEEVRLVNQEHRVDALFSALLDMATDGMEQGAGRSGRRETERDAELAIEVPTAERGIVIVGEPEARGRNAVAKHAQDTGLPNAGLADEGDGGALVERLEQGVDDDLLGRR
jgi:hypothetical protein